MGQRQRRKAGLTTWALGIGVAIAATAAAAAATYYYNSLENNGPSQKRVKNKNSSVAVVLSPSVISARLPLAELLSNYKKALIVLPPGIKRQDLADFNISIDDSFKVIECDTEMGVFHLLKHLKYGFNFVCLGDFAISMDEVEKLQLKSFLPTIVYLEQNNEMIYEEFLKYLFY